MFDLDINFGAFFLSGVLAFLLGVIWYHPKVMGKRWVELRGMEPDALKPSILPIVATFFLWTLAACFYAFLAAFLEVDSAAGYFCLSCLLWVAFSMPPTLMGGLYTGQALESVAIDTSYQLGGYYVFAAVHIAFLMMGSI